MVDGWIEELHRRVDAFNELRKTKTQARAEIETGASKKARQVLTDAYRDLVDTLNAMQIIAKSENFERIAQHLNELIDANRVTMKAKKTAKKVGKEADTIMTDNEVWVWRTNGIFRGVNGGNLIFIRIHQHRMIMVKVQNKLILEPV